MAGNTKAADEMFCRSCGEAIKKDAEICPECGVRNESGGSSRLESSGTSSPRRTNTVHDPSEYETTVSESWYYGIVAGLGAWVLLLALFGVVGDGPLGALLGLVALGAWFGMPVAAYFDMKYVRANSKWNPNTVVWVIAMLIWFVNIGAGVVYLYRRHETVGVP